MAETRQETYKRKSGELLKRCVSCRNSPYPPSVERCDECTIGRRLRMLESEYSDVTGWSHSTW